MGSKVMGRMLLVATLLAVFAAAPAVMASEGRVAVYDTSGISAAGSYYLTREIPGSFKISADDVFLDLNGFTITGTLTISGSGTLERVRVFNGKVRGGIDAQQVQGLILNDLAVSNQLKLTDCVKGTVERCATESIELYACLSMRVARNTNLKGVGIYLAANAGVPCKDVEVVDNTVEGSTLHGICLEGASGCTVARNVVHESDQVGIYLHPTVPITALPSGNRIAQNTVSGNGMVGIFLILAPQSQVTLNVVTGNGTEFATGAGIYIGDSKGTEISHNTVGGNGQSGGIWLQGTSDYCNVHHNTVTSHTLPSSSGIVIDSDHNSVDWNTSNYNTGYGFSGSGNNSILSHNRALGNTSGGYSIPIVTFNTIVDYSGPAATAYPTNF